LIILDTSVWIEYLKNNKIFFPKICKLLESGEILAVECVFSELLQGVKNEKEAEIILKYWEHLPKKKYRDIIIKSGIYSKNNKLIDKGVGLIDSIIIMHGIKSKSKIWTIDKKLLKVLPEELNYEENPNFFLN